jgi:hypothetical protein
MTATSFDAYHHSLHNRPFLRSAFAEGPVQHFGEISRGAQRRGSGNVDGTMRLQVNGTAIIGSFLRDLPAASPTRPRLTFRLRAARPFDPAIDADIRCAVQRSGRSRLFLHNGNTVSRVSGLRGRLRRCRRRPECGVISKCVVSSKYASRAASWEPPRDCCRGHHDGGCLENLGYVNALTFASSSRCGGRRALGLAVTKISPRHQGKPRSLCHGHRAQHRGLRPNSR